MLRSLCIVVGIAGAAGPVWAACPTAQDLGAGIALTYLDGAVEVFRRDAAGAVTVDGISDGIVTHRLTLDHGVYLGRYVAVEEGAEVEMSQSIYAYPEGDAAPMPPVVDATWEGAVELTDGGEMRVEVQRHEVGLPLEVTIEECTLTVLPITITYGAEAEYVEIVHYFPDLEVGYLHAFANQGRDMNQQTVTMIEAVQ